MKQELVEKFLTKMYPDIEIKIISYELMSRFDFNDNGQFVEVDPSIFMDLKILNNENEVQLEITKYLTKFTGYEFSITLV